jgi:hypothetical protein
VYHCQCFGEEREWQEELLRLLKPVQNFEVFLNAGGRRITLDRHADVLSGFCMLAEFADFGCLISSCIEFIPPLGNRRASQVEERSINVWRKRGRNRLSIS